MVIAIIGVLASLVIASFSNVTQDTRNVIALQQQAVLQEALNNWISQASSPAGAGSLQAAKTLYDGAASASAKLALVSPYLDPATTAQFTAHGAVANALNTETMEKTQQYVVFSTWEAGSYPKVVLLP